LGASNFIFVTNNRSTTSQTTIGSATVLPTAVTVATLTTGGLTVTTTGSTTGQGLVYGGMVEISGVTSAMAAGNLRYIEGSGVRVTTASAFAGSLVLVGSGAGFTTVAVPAGVTSVTAGILIDAALTTGVSGDTGSSLTLLQTGTTSGTGIKVAATLTSYGTMLLNQAGSAQYGINLSAALSQRIGSELAVVQSGYSTASDTAAIVLDSPAVLSHSIFAAGTSISLQQTGYSASTKAILFNTTAQPQINSAGSKNGTVLIKTNNRDLLINRPVQFDKTKTLVINLGTGHLLNPTSTVNSAGIVGNGTDVFFTGAATGHSGVIFVGSPTELSSGSFTFLTDYSNYTDAVTLDNSSSASDYSLGWNTRLQGVDPVIIAANDPLFKYVEYAGGFKVTTRAAASTVQRVGVKFGGTVTISGISTGDARNLNYIEGAGIAVSGSASSFTGLLTLVSYGAGITSGSDIAGIVVKANLSAGSNLSLMQTGAADGHGILVGGASLTAGGNLLLQQLGTVGATRDGFYFNATGTAAGTGVGLTANLGGTVTLKTNGLKLSLNNNDNFTVSGSRLRIDLGAAILTSAGGTVPTDGYRIKAEGMELLFTGAKSGNSGIFAVQGGSFTYVSDQTAVTTIPTIDASTTLANLGLSSVSYGGSSGARTLGGLTITGKIDSALKGLGVIYSTQVTISGVTTGSVAGGLTYIEGRSILVSGTASSFSGALTLVSTG
ncbi:MAG: hypothetical protein ORO03_11190, partial [Alphaproteobacteria bacterium]|nr:hypothetical protein [Alphaproteobacteria bacterium]